MPGYRYQSWSSYYEQDDDILCLPKIHLLQQIPHLQFHVLNQSSNIDHMTLIILHREVSLYLPRHIPAQIHFPKAIPFSG